MATKTSTLKDVVGAQAQAAKEAALKLQNVTTAQKNQALEFLAQALEITTRLRQQFINGKKPACIMRR